MILENIFFSQVNSSCIKQTKTNFMSGSDLLICGNEGMNLTELNGLNILPKLFTLLANEKKFFEIGRCLGFLSFYSNLGSKMDPIGSTGPLRVKFEKTQDSSIDP